MGETFRYRSGTVTLEVDRPWVDRGFVDPLLESEDAPGVYRWTFRAVHAPIVLGALRGAFPALAASIRERLGLAEDAISAGDADPLRDLATATRPSDVSHPVARALVDEVTDAMQKRIPAGLKAHPYQQVGIAFSRMTGYRALIGDEMGLGKTIQAIGAMATDPRRLLPALIVAPAIVAVHWRRELAAWLPSVPVVVLSRRADAPPPGFRGIVLTKKDVLFHQKRALRAFDPRLIVVDEVQYYKNPRARMSRALRGLVAAAPHVLLLSGTPFKNRLTELRTVLDYLAPGPEDESADGLTARMERLAIRRTKAQVAAWLPAKTHRYLPFDIEPAARREYRQAEEEFEGWLRSELDRRQIAKGENIPDAEARVDRALAAEALAKLGYLRQLTGRSKVSAAIEYLRQAAENGVPILAFAYFSEVIEDIRAGLQAADVRVVVVDGTLSPNQKQAANDAFERGEVDVVIGSSALLTGASYPRAQEVLFVERYWTPADEMQAEDRAHRITSRHPILVSYLHANATVDDRVRAILADKRRLYERMLATGKIEPLEDSAHAVLADFLGRRPVPVAPDVRRAAAPKDKPRRPPVTRDDVVALSFESSRWSRREATEWATVSGWRGEIEQSRDRWILRVRRPIRGLKYHAIRLAPGVAAIVPRRA